MDYCSNVLIQNMTIYAPSESPYTSGIVPGLSKDFLTSTISLYFLSDCLELQTSSCNELFLSSFPTSYIFSIPKFVYGTLVLERKVLNLLCVYNCKFQILPSMFA